MCFCTLWTRVSQKMSLILLNCFLFCFLNQRHINPHKETLREQWSDEIASGWHLSLHWQSLRATNQELVADILVVFLYVQGLDLGMGDAGTVLVNGEGRSTGETCQPGHGWVQRRTSSLVNRGESVWCESEKQASVGYGYDGTHRVAFFTHGWMEKIRLSGNRQQMSSCLRIVPMEKDKAASLIDG